MEHRSTPPKQNPRKQYPSLLRQYLELRQSTMLYLCPALLNYAFTAHHIEILKLTLPKRYITEPCPTTPSRDCRKPCGNTPLRDFTVLNFTFTIRDTTSACLSNTIMHLTITLPCPTLLLLGRTLLHFALPLPNFT